jgi:hypothetical protein
MMAEVSRAKSCGMESSIDDTLSLSLESSLLLSFSLGMDISNLTNAYLVKGASE